MSLSIQEENARLTVNGKSIDDTSTDSGDGWTIDQLTLEDLKDLGYDLPDIDDDTHILIGYDDGTWLYIEGLDEPIDLGDLDLSDLDLDWELDTLLPFDGSLLGVDDDLNIYEEELPDHIDIVTLPNKLEYYDGQTIDITGMRVVPKNEDGSTWTSAKYFRGYIPLQEIVIDPDKADINKSESGYVSDLDTSPFDQPIITTQKAHFEFYSAGYLYIYDVTFSKPVLCWIEQLSEYSNRFRYYFPSDTYHDSCECSLAGTIYADFSTFVHDGKRLYGAGGVMVINSELKNLDVPYIIREAVYDSSINTAGWTAVFGEKLSGKQTIDAKWARPGDGKLLSTSFEIEVMESGGGGR